MMEKKRTELLGFRCDVNPDKPGSSSKKVDVEFSGTLLHYSSVVYNHHYSSNTMSKQQQPILSLAMSQIISPDAPLLSPTDSQWDGQQPLFSPHDNFTYSYYNLPPSPPNSEGSHLTDSPVPAARMLKMRTTPDNDHEICLPTHQVFDFADIPRPPTPPSRSPSLGVEAGRAFSHFTGAQPGTASSAGSKRSASPAAAVPKKRAVGERVSSKDFIPPDVSGLSKREARLVKNRAAAFLSRQRKREEFENMEMYVHPSFSTHTLFCSGAYHPVCLSLYLDASPN